LLSRSGGKGFENFSRSIPAKAENTDNRFVRRGFEECFQSLPKPEVTVGVESVKEALIYSPKYFSLTCPIAAGNANTVDRLKVCFGQYISVYSDAGRGHYSSSTAVRIRYTLPTTSG